MSPRSNVRSLKHPRLRTWARGARAAVALGIARGLHRFPRAEPLFVRVGRGARWWWVASLYWHSHEALAALLRNTPQRFRPISVEGLQLTLDITNYTASFRYFHGVPYEPGLTALVAALRPGDVFVDVGANVGLFALIAARRVFPGGRVIAFEPHPRARLEMLELLARNGVAGMVEVVEAAASDVPQGSARLFLTDDSVLSTLNPQESPLAADFAFTDSIDVELTTVDSWLQRRGVEAVSLRLVKIDVEGCEDAVVRGMAATLRAAPRLVVACETSPDSAADRLLREAGFTRRPLDVRHGQFGNYVYER
ncbi:MAG TPA: FkbM family methyltransferase [Vicinamibacterales bacterium]|nr:FkbM family methyltransferase [Vicinamibacterales bacterium]